MESVPEIKEEDYLDYSDYFETKQVSYKWGPMCGNKLWWMYVVVNNIVCAIF